MKIYTKSSRQRSSMKKGVLRNFAKFTGKHLCQRLFFNKVACQSCCFIKKESLAQVFSCKFYDISKNTSGRLLLILAYWILRMMIISLAFAYYDLQEILR